MNVLKRYAISSVFACAAIAAQAPAPFSITISGPTTPVKIGDQFPIAIVVANTSDRKIVLGRASGGDDVGFMDYEGYIAYKASPDSIVQTVPLTAHPEALSIVSSQAKWLEPGQSFTDTLHITDRFDMSKPGSYFFHLARKARPDLGHAQIASNQIEIDVVK